VANSSGRQEKIREMSAPLSRNEEAEALSRIPLFRQLDQTELKSLAESVDQVRYKAGEVIFYANDPGDALYVIDEGAVRIWVHDADVKEVTLSELQPGEFLGEMAVLDGGARSAVPPPPNATAIVESTLHRLRRDDFQNFLLQYPHAATDVIREVAARLRQTNQLVSERVTRNINEAMEEKMTLGQRVADKVASFGGSWTFIFIYGGALLAWIAINTFLLSRIGRGETGAQFDPYPYILLNLMLSMTAALQAPIIMMSQNRAGEKDRLAAEQDFKVNLKSELMLEEMLRKDSERGEKMDQLMEMVRSLQSANATPASGDRHTAS
jgi:CRP/FNR family transcriptional regulator, cyclic AMP receptor protein